MALDIKDRALGVGNRILTALGVVAGALVSAGQYLELIPPEYRTSKWYAVAAALVALGTALKLPGKKIVSAGTAALLLVFAMPAFGQVDPTAGTVDGAGMADAVAQSAPDPRWSITLGPVNLAPSVSFSPTVISLKDFSLSVGPNVGAGVDIVAVRGAALGYGGSLHATLRETSSGNKPLASLYAILPFLAQYKVRPGISYQFSGGAAAFKDALIFGFAISDNFGYAAK